jgi:hypothetical protein
MTSLLAATGGGMFASICLGRPIPLCSDPLLLPTFLAVWWLINCSPFDLVFLLVSVPPLSYIIQVLEGVSRAQTSLKFANLGSALSLPAGLIAGTLAGSFGATFLYLEQKGRQGGTSPAYLFTSPTPSLSFCFWVSLLAVYIQQVGGAESMASLAFVAVPLSALAQCLTSSLQLQFNPFYLVEMVCMRLLRLRSLHGGVRPKHKVKVT